jgi:hypothetical protein
MPSVFRLPYSLLPASCSLFLLPFLVAVSIAISIAASRCRLAGLNPSEVYC